MFNVNKVEIPETKETFGTGWVPPVPDLRDSTEEDTDIAKAARKMGITPALKLKAFPPKVDLRKWCSPIENQLQLGSCTAHAAVGVVEYLTYGSFL